MVIENGLGTFADTWRHIIDAIQQATTAGDWGVDASQVIAGNWQADTEMAPPGIIVYLTPGKLFDVQNVTSQVATISVFPVIDAREDIVQTTGDVIALGWKVVQVLNSVGLTIRWGREKVTLDTIADGWAASSVKCEVWYKEI